MDLELEEKIRKLQEALEHHEALDPVNKIFIDCLKDMLIEHQTSLITKLQNAE